MNISTYYEQQGSGSPIVFIHGSYATTATWKKMVEQLAAHHHCIAIKLPGHCGTPDPEDFAAPTMETELAIIEAVVAELTDQPIHLVGHSYGGVVALAQALKGSLSLTQLTLFEPVATWVLGVAGDTAMNEKVEQFLAGYRQDVLQQVPYACGQVIDFWGGEGSFQQLPDFIRDGMVPLALNNIRHWDICTVSKNTLTDLQHLRVPTRVATGDQSNPVARAIVSHLCANIPDSKSYLIEGATHFLVTSHVDECLAAMQN